MLFFPPLFLPSSFFFSFFAQKRAEDRPAGLRGAEGGRAEGETSIIRAFTSARGAHLFVNHLSAGANRTPGPVTPPRSASIGPFVFAGFAGSSGRFPFYYDVVRTTRDRPHRIPSARMPSPLFPASPRNPLSSRYVNRKSSLFCFSLSLSLSLSHFLLLSSPLLRLSIRCASPNGAGGER